MLTQIAPYSIQGVIWYQGESDGDGHPEVYDTVFTRLIENWRTLWNEELPFLFVQIAPLRQCLMCDGNNYIKLRECQEKVSRYVSKTWMTTSGDVGLEWDIHPKDKEPIGRRLALLARGHIYREDILCDPPKAAEITRIKNHLTIRFENGEGLWQDGSQINSLYAKMPDGTFVSIQDVKIQKDWIYLDIPEGTVALEYAQEAYYHTNLYNAAGIPAIPFRYDV